jgi:hypothetical protein
MRGKGEERQKEEAIESKSELQRGKEKYIMNETNVRSLRQRKFRRK